VRVRTYGFPGCFTRPPGTSTRHHPHEPTASKPVVPLDVLLLQCSAGFVPGLSMQQPEQTPPRRHTGHQQARRGPGPLRGTRCQSARKPSGGWWRGLTPQWPRSLRLGGRVYIQTYASRERSSRDFRHSPRTFEKRSHQSRKRPGGLSPESHIDQLSPSANARPTTLLRRGLSQLRQ
jgi:hypothetical protein